MSEWWAIAIAAGLEWQLGHGAEWQLQHQQPLSQFVNSNVSLATLILIGDLQQVRGGQFGSVFNHQPERLDLASRLQDLLAREQQLSLAGLDFEAFTPFP
jgi:hypothetical protein